MSINLGAMTGKSREVADTMERRNIDIACVQETKWKGAKAREIGGGFKLFYNGGNNKRNGVGVIVKKEWQDNTMEIKGALYRIWCGVNRLGDSGAKVV